MVKEWHDDDEKNDADPLKKKYFEFECPDCNAHNPWGDGFKVKEEISCHYCGTAFEVRLSDSGKLKFKSL
jgi:transcription elongation factor Elf1